MTVILRRKKAWLVSHFWDDGVHSAVCIRGVEDGRWPTSKATRGASMWRARIGHRPTFDDSSQVRRLSRFQPCHVTAERIIIVKGCTCQKSTHQSTFIQWIQLLFTNWMVILFKILTNYYHKQLKKVNKYSNLMGFFILHPDFNYWRRWVFT
jgi:hypothetical protein